MFLKVKAALMAVILISMMACGETTDSADNKTCQKSGETTEVIQPYEEIADEDWDRIFQGNVAATHKGCQIFAAQMATQDQGGSILNAGFKALYAI